ncbi:MAG TPA: CorA family divalent cation transporter [Bacteroidia bacterium]|jgi:magnesium transporter|nr:magnesium and cobalt transport protein CorA [Bacteroidota bacterium]MBP9789473.1 magnesium and cobalt transport protein CorA [Bacteroidia bacterium]MBK7431338.1 magnesium and cobalt transport protein CorA [Bacteroidota bacterium]MBK7571738.1 magnesium and cobalt transport protein CorA [Bacteroidota bacterium]MBK8587312.1 magnesium and cobalt transport protein CorA [Bacteroidota bacterium]
MLRVFYRLENEIKKVEGPDCFEHMPIDKLFWVDLQFASDEERGKVETVFKFNFSELQSENEIESNSRFYESENLILITSYFIAKEDGRYETTPVFFYLSGQVLITQRNADLPSFAETVKKIKRNRNSFKNGSEVLEVILETKVDIDSDFLEIISKEISLVSNGLSISTTNEEELLIKINSYQEIAMLIRESFIDKQKVVSSLLKSKCFINDARLTFLMKDINSVLTSISFIFARLDYLQNTLLGMINMQQNKTIKIFTIVSVIFMPPTLIASIYGMNFKIMPELEWTNGYPFAIVLIIASSLATLLLFRTKKWL